MSLLLRRRPSATRDLPSWGNHRQDQEMGGQPAGFEYLGRCDEVRISHHGSHATTLRGQAARQFLDDLAYDDGQLFDGQGDRQLQARQRTHREAAPAAPLTSCSNDL